MEIIQFDLVGKMAHFRKYYANNTAMSFSIPPRTTLMGMLAAILGLPKDEYYEALASDKIRIGIALRSPIKKSFHRLNLLSIKSIGNLKSDFEKERPFNSDFRGTGGRIQTPFEVITGNSLQQDDICYRVFVSSYFEGDDNFIKLKNNVLNGKIHYSLSFGIANFSTYIQNVKYYIDNQITSKIANNELLAFNSAVISNKISELKFEKQENYNFVEEELMPADFVANNDRELSKMNRVLFTHNALPLEVVYTGQYYQLPDNQKITFLEND
jgi:CRISPR-associated protein Cas5h